MRAKEVKEVVQKLVDKKVPVFLWGAPGIGKSSIVKQIACEKEIGFIDLRLALLDPTDLKGIPLIDKENNTARWISPSFLPKDGEGILFLDELNSAPPSVSASAYQLILDRAVGEYRLPDGWSIVAAGNNEIDRGVVYKMPLPLANRFVHLEMEVNVDDWREWAYKSNIDERVIAYISFKNDSLFNFDPKTSQKSFATPRSWEAVSNILSSGIEPLLLLDTVSGAVGKDTAVDFLNFIKVADKLPDIDAIFGGDFEYMDDLNGLYVLSSSIVSRYLSNPDEKVLENIINYTKELKSEFAVLIIRDLQRNGVRMEHLESFKDWVKRFSYLLS